jgi:hypothetical protein
VQAEGFVLVFYIPIRTYVLEQAPFGCTLGRDPILRRGSPSTRPVLRIDAAKLEWSGLWGDRALGDRRFRITGFVRSWRGAKGSTGCGSRRPRGGPRRPGVSHHAPIRPIPTSSHTLSPPARPEENTPFVSLWSCGHLLPTRERLCSCTPPFP